MNQYVVIEDTKFPAGAVLSEPQAVPARLRGAALLPLDGKDARTAINGYSVRHWGAGEKVDPGLPSLVCPMVLGLVRGLHTLNWCARIIGKPSEREPLHGSLRVISDGFQTSMKCALSSVGGKNVFELKRLGEQDVNGWVISGSAGVDVESEGIYGFGLHGAAPGVSVLWSALSQSE